MDGAIILAIAVLVGPLPSVLIGIGLWKMTTETLFMTSGSLPFEWIERTRSDMAPMELYDRVITEPCRQGTWLFPTRLLTSSPPAAGVMLRGAVKGSPADEVPASSAVA